MTDEEIIKKVNKRLIGNEHLQDLDNWHGGRYVQKVLVCYTRWLERAKSTEEIVSFISSKCDCRKRPETVLGEILDWVWLKQRLLKIQ